MAKSRFSIAIFFKLLCSISLMAAPTVIGVVVPPCVLFKENGKCVDDDNDDNNHLFPLCAAECQTMTVKAYFGICYIREDLELHFEVEGNDPENTGDVVDDSSSAVISEPLTPAARLAAPRQCFCCIKVAPGFAPEEAEQPS